MFDDFERKKVGMYYGEIVCFIYYYSRFVATFKSINTHILHKNKRHFILKPTSTLSIKFLLQQKGRHLKEFLEFPNM